MARCPRARGLSAFIVLLMLRSMVVTNATVLLDFAVVTNAIVLRDFVLHEIEASAEVRAELLQGGRTRLRPILRTAAATITALVLLAPSNNDSLIAAGLAIVVIGGLFSSTLHDLLAPHRQRWPGRPAHTPPPPPQRLHNVRPSPGI